MNDEDHMELAKIGMRFGGFIAVAAALLALGGEELFSTVDDLYFQHIIIQLLWGKLISGGILILAGVIIAGVGTCWAHKEIGKLKKNPDTSKPHHDYENQTLTPINLPENNTDHHFTAFAFLSGTSLTALYFLIQSDSKNSILLTFLGVASMLFIISTIGRLNVTTRRIARGSDYSHALSWMVIIGLALLVGSLGLLILDFNVISGVIVLVVMLVSLSIIEYLARKSKKQPN